MASAGKGGNGIDKLSIVVFSGDYDRVHYALATAAAACAVGKAVTLFFTMGATRALLGPRPDGTPGWTGLEAPGDDGPPKVRDAHRRNAGIGGMEELIVACAELGATFMVCEMGLRIARVAPETLRSDVTIAEGGIVTFLGDASRDGAMLLV